MTRPNRDLYGCVNCTRACTVIHSGAQRGQVGGPIALLVVINVLEDPSDS